MVPHTEPEGVGTHDGVIGIGGVRSGTHRAGSRGNARRRRRRIGRSQVGNEGEAGGALQPGGEYSEECAGRAVVAEHLAREIRGHVQVAVGSPRQVVGVVRVPIGGGDERSQVRAGRGVEADDVVGPAERGVEQAVRAEAEATDRARGARARMGPADPGERARRRVEARDVVQREAADVQLAVGPERQAARERAVVQAEQGMRGAVRVEQLAGRSERAPDRTVGSLDVAEHDAAGETRDAAVDERAVRRFEAIEGPERAEIDATVRAQARAGTQDDVLREGW